MRIIIESQLAKLLSEGNIVARFDGQAEFGPRALGGRSLLASPLLAESKQRLNLIKSRQDWRPVAPIVQRERIAEFFEGPEDCPYMNMAHTILMPHQKKLLALKHPDGTARAQTLDRSDDPFLHDTLYHLGLLTKYPIVVNTSLNGKNQPILETPEQALEFYFRHDDIDYLLLGNTLIHRVDKALWHDTQLGQNVITSIFDLAESNRAILIQGSDSMEISQQALEVIKRLPSEGLEISEEVSEELSAAVLKQFLVKSREVNDFD